MRVAERAPCLLTLLEGTVSGQASVASDGQLWLLLTSRLCPGCEAEQGPARAEEPSGASSTTA